MFYLLIILIMLSPVIRFIIKRIVLITKIRKVCKKKKYQVKIVNRFWIFSSIINKNCDLYITTDKEVLSIKLFGTLFKSTHICLISPAKYAIRRTTLQLVSTYNAIEYTENHKQPYDFKYKLDDSAYDKNLVPILLMCPISSHITKKSYNTLETVGNGDDVGEGYFYTRSGLIRRLEEK